MNTLIRPAAVMCAIMMAGPMAPGIVVAGPNDFCCRKPDGTHEMTSSSACAFQSGTIVPAEGNCIPSQPLPRH